MLPPSSHAVGGLVGRSSPGSRTAPRWRLCGGPRDFTRRGGVVEDRQNWRFTPRCGLGPSPTGFVHSPQGCHLEWLRGSGETSIPKELLKRMVDELKGVVLPERGNEPGVVLSDPPGSCLRIRLGPREGGLNARLGTPTLGVFNHRTSCCETAASNCKEFIRPRLPRHSPDPDAAVVYRSSATLQFATRRVSNSQMGCVGASYRCCGTSGLSASIWKGEVREHDRGQLRQLWCEIFR